MISPRALAILRGAVLVGCLAFTRPSAAVDVPYDKGTSTPEGLAVCGIKGTIKGADQGTTLDVTIVPTSGEGALGIDLRSGAGIAVSAGVQPGCDIFPNTPATGSVPIPASVLKVKFRGVLNMHAHPGSDCASAGAATGTIVMSVTPPAVLKSPKVTCDHDEAHANLRLLVAPMPTGVTGEPLAGAMVVRNHGPGDAIGVVLELKLPKSFFPTKATPTQGSCFRDFRKHRVHCELGTLPFFGLPAGVDVEMIPLKKGVVKTTELVRGENNGKIFDRKDVIATDVAKGNSSILNVTIKCKGAAGTVTIDPNGSGGKTTCTCPDPNDTTKEEATCIEIYAQKTTVTLTPAATTGQFDKWKGACAGSPAACSVTLDPAAQHPDVGTTAKFK